VASYLELSFDLGILDPEAAESACEARGAIAVTFGDSADDPVLEPGPGEVRLWPATRVTALFDLAHSAPPPALLAASLGEALGLAPRLIRVTAVADRAWEREWLKDFHAMRFGRRLWICPRHERVEDPEAVVVTLDPGLAFGTGTHPSTGLCLEWLDAHAHELHAPAEHSEGMPGQGLDSHAHELHAPAEHSEGMPGQGLDTHAHELHAPAEHSEGMPGQGLDRHAHESCASVGADVIDYGCGSGILALACARLGAQAVHCFDIDPQALIATRDNALANAVAGRVHVHERAATLPHGVDVLLANILSGPLCELAPAFAARVRSGGYVVLAGLMDADAADVTAAYAPWFHVSRSGSRDGWTCLAGRRH
jgi:ribosomal protein L11 methylase PrmA